MLKYFKKNIPLQLILIVLIPILFGKHIPLEVKELLYAISLSLKSGLVFVIPFVIFIYIVSCFLSFKEGAFKFLSILILTVCLSNLLSTLIAFFVTSSSFLYLSNVSIFMLDKSSPLTPSWSTNLPQILSNEYSLLLGFLLSFFCSINKKEQAKKISQRFKRYADTFLNRCFVPLLPLFILGFVIKMEHDDMLLPALRIYAPIVLIFVFTQIFYILFLYGFSVKFKAKKWQKSLLNVFPSAVMGFSAMSSLAALPFTIQGAKKNTDKNDFVEMIVPTTANIHLIGDSIAIPTMALAILLSFDFPIPSFSAYLIFAVSFVLNKFAVAAVPGGGILVMIPVLQKYFAFNDDMISIITMLYLIFDGIITSVNVLGNGAFAVLFTKFYSRK